jgi:hypothetical protein
MREGSAGSLSCTEQSGALPKRVFDRFSRSRRFKLCFDRDDAIVRDLDAQKSDAH